MIVIHFGLRKAGSSSIQTFLRVNQDYLRSFGYDYPKIGHYHNQSHLNIANEVRKNAAYRVEDGSLSELATYWQRNRGKVLIISSEILEMAKPDEITNLLNILSVADDEFMPIMIIRYLSDLVVSSYNQSAKVGNLDSPGRNIGDFDEFYDSWISRRRSDYFKTADRWAGTFGWERIKVRLLDKQFLYNRDLIEDFMKSARINLTDKEKELLRHPQVANVSPGWRVVEALRALYAHRHGLPEHHPLAKVVKQGGDFKNSVLGKAEKLGGRLGWNEDRGRYLTEVQAQTCLDIYGRAVEALNSHLPEPLPKPKTLDEVGFVAREFMPGVSRIPPRELRAFYDELGDELGAGSAGRQTGRPIERHLRNERRTLP